MFRKLTAILILFFAAALLSMEAAEPIRGLWLLPRGDWHNSGRADVPGDLTQAPRERWSFGTTQQPYDFLRPIVVAREGAFFAATRSTLEAIRPDGTRLWHLPNFGATSVVEVFEFGERGAAALVGTGNSGLALVDAATGRIAWRWNLPAGVSSVGAPKVWRRGEAWRLVLFPQGTLEGECWEFTEPNAAPRLVWKQTYTNRYWANFGPFAVIADMDNDGRDDIVLMGKPAYAAVIDPDTGKIQFDLQYAIPGEDSLGRPYGLLQAADLDSDGFRDLVVASCQVEEYIAVLRNEGGKAFRLAWSHFVEHDFPDDVRELRPQVTSVVDVDVDKDGRKEIVLGLFNDGGDGRWRTVALDALAGWNARKLDLPRYFWGCYDLDGDNTPEIITSTEPARRVQPVTTVQAIEGRSGRDIAVLEKTRLVTASALLPPDVSFHANRSTPIYARLGDKRPAGLVTRREGPAAESLWNLSAEGASQFAPFAVTPEARVVFLGQRGNVVGQPDLSIGPGGKAPTAPAVSGPLVSIAAGKRELIAAQADGTIIGGVVDWSRPSAFGASWTVRGVAPAVWIGADGARIVAAFDSEADRLLLYRPELGQANVPAMVTIDLPHEPFRAPGMILPFGVDEPRFYVAMKTGVHTCAGAVYDARGKQVWLDEKNGPYPRAGAVLDPARGTLVIDDHGKHFLYGFDGKKHLIAHGWGTTIPGRGDGAKYALPIVGPFGAGGALRIVMSPGLDALEVLDDAGARLARAPYGSTYEREWCGSAVARIRPVDRDAWDVGMLAKDGTFHCADVATGKTRWTFATGVEAAYPTRVAVCDIDGDGRDNFVMGLANGQFLALDERDGQGVVLWRAEVGAAIRDVVIADLDGDAKAEIIVETDDGRLRVLGREQAGSR